MSKQEESDAWSDLTTAAGALERELRRFERLTADARRVPLHSRKAVERAARATAEAAGVQQQVDAALGELVHAIAAVRDRHAANAATLGERGEEIRLRADEVGSLLERFAALGAEGRRVNQLVREVAEMQRDATTPEGVRTLVAAIVAIEEQMAALMEGAREMHQAATLAEITDVALGAKSLRQQVSAARNKLALLRENLGQAPPAASSLN